MKPSWYFNQCISIGPQLVHSSSGCLMDLEMWRWAAKRKKTWLSFYFSGLYLLGCSGTEPPGIGCCCLPLVLCGLPLGLQRTLHSLFVPSLLMSSQELDKICVSHLISTHPKTHICARFGQKEDQEYIFFTWLINEAAPKALNSISTLAKLELCYM